jgi:hypothetical protein
MISSLKFTKIQKQIQIFLFFISISLIICQETTQTVKGVAVKVHGKSGKISIFTNNSTNSSNTTTDEVTINFASLIERDVNGSEVGKTGPIKHSFENFAQMDFSVSPVEKITFQNLSAYCVNLTAYNVVTTNNTFTGSVFIFNETGIINMGGNDTVQVNPGSVKFSVNIENWPFC